MNSVIRFSLNIAHYAPPMERGGCAMKFTSFLVKKLVDLLSDRRIVVWYDAEMKVTCSLLPQVTARLYLAVRLANGGGSFLAAARGWGGPMDLEDTGS
ncbi:hypothetical protein [Desulfosoma sp.]